MRVLMEDKVAVDYSFAGQNGEASFKANTTILDCIFGKNVNIEFAMKFK
jgi:hypothetical protein